MAKNKRTKKGGNARKGTGRNNPAGANAAARRSGIPSVVKAVCSITDPFCTAAVGSKYPDSGSSRTLAMQARGFTLLTTDSSGRAAAVFTPTPANGYGKAATFSGATNTVATWGSMNDYAGPTSIGTSFNWRVVSLGVRATSILPATSNSGSVGVINIPAGDVLPSVAIDLDSMAYASNLRVPCNDPAGITAVARNDGVASKLYRDEGVTSSSTTFYSLGNEVLVVYVVGGPATTAAVNIQYVVNYELTFDLSSVMNRVATPAALENTLVQTAANAVYSSVQPAVRGGMDLLTRMFHARATTFLSRLTRGVVPALANYAAGTGMMATAQAALEVD